jgi:hypothetical protein
MATNALLSGAARRDLGEENPSINKLKQHLTRRLKTFIFGFSAKISRKIAYSMANVRRERSGVWRA